MAGDRADDPDPERSDARDRRRGEGGIYRLCDDLAKTGLALLFTSSEVEETLGVCDRLLVLYRGTILKEFARGDATKADVMFWISGGREALATAS